MESSIRGLGKLNKEANKGFTFELVSVVDNWGTVTLRASGRQCGTCLRVITAEELCRLSTHQLPSVSGGEAVRLPLNELN